MCSAVDLRVLYLTMPGHNGDAEIRALRGDGFDVHAFDCVDEVSCELDFGVGLLLLAEGSAADASLIAHLSMQPTWSELPLILIAGENADDVSRLRDYEHTTVLSGSWDKVTLLTAVRAGIACRQKQYELRNAQRRERGMRQKLREEDRRRDEFLATLGHELRNPISPIQNALELLDLAEASIRDERELRDIMFRQVKHLTRIVDDLLDVSRVSRGRLHLSRSVFDLRESIRDGLEVVRPLIEHSDQTLQVDLGKEPLMVDGDPERLSQVTANLLNNAAKYSEEGGRIVLRSRRVGDTVRFFVSDNGIGIEKYQLESIFDLFQQHDTDPERGQAGLGIGLTLVKRLLDMHDGTVFASSDGRGCGSTFTVVLPAARGATQAVRRDEPNDFGSVEPKAFRVLIVEDTRAIRVVLARLLSNLGHEVFIAEDGRQGLERARLERPDIIFSDIAMPNMNGYELARRIRRTPSLNNVTLVAMTGFGQERDRQRAFENGFDYHMTKPVDVRELKDLFTSLSAQEAR